MKSSQKTIVSELKRLSTSTSMHKYKFAKTLNQASLTNWSNTDYKTFDKMVTIELNDSSEDIYQMLYEFRCMQKNEWFDAATQMALLELLGWKRFVLAIQFETEKMTAPKFTTKYRKIAFYKLKQKQEQLPGGDRAYSYSLPHIIANKYDGILMNHGMTIVNGRRHGVRAAMISFIDTL
jgi:hypothetical protein